MEWKLNDESWIGRDASASLHNEQLTQNWSGQGGSTAFRFKEPFLARLGWNRCRDT